MKSPIPNPPFLRYAELSTPLNRHRNAGWQPQAKLGDGFLRHANVFPIPNLLQFSLPDRFYGKD